MIGSTPYLSLICVLSIATQFVSCRFDQCFVSVSESPIVTITIGSFAFNFASVPASGELVGRRTPPVRSIVGSRRISSISNEQAG